MRSNQLAALLLSQYKSNRRLADKILENNRKILERLLDDNAKILEKLQGIEMARDDEELPISEARILPLRQSTVHQLRVVEQTQPESPSMRQMVRVALSESFPRGATRGQLVEHFNERRHANINTASLSVMLTLMRKSGELEHGQGVWRLKRKGPGE